jgi:hypothetical protein
MEQLRNAYRILVRKHEGKKTQWRTLLKGVIKKEGMDWIQLVQDRVKRQALENKPVSSIKGGEFLDQLSH